MKPLYQIGFLYLNIQLDMKDDYCNKNFTGEVFRNGEKIPRAKNIEEFLEYGRNEKPCLFVDTKLNETFYNFFAVEDPRGLAPKGYKVASADNWNGIIAECGIQDVEDAGVDEFDCLEEDYIADNEDCTNLEANKENFKFYNNENKLNIIPAGFISEFNGRVGVNKQARYWTSNNRSAGGAFWVGFNSEYIFLGAYDHIKNTFSTKEEGLQIRLVKEK